MCELTWHSRNTWRKLWNENSSESLLQLPAKSPLSSLARHHLAHRPENFAWNTRTHFSSFRHHRHGGAAEASWKLVYTLEAFPDSGHISIAFNIPASSCANKLGRGFMRFSFRICLVSDVRFMKLNLDIFYYLFTWIKFLIYKWC